MEFLKANDSLRRKRKKEDEEMEQEEEERGIRGGGEVCIILLKESQIHGEYSEIQTARRGRGIMNWKEERKSLRVRNRQ